MALKADVALSEEAGYFRIFAQPPGGVRREITMFRGAPIMPTSVTFQDPFSDATAALTLSQVTPWDAIGQGDLDWLVPNTDVDIVWNNTGRFAWDWRWEGYIASFDFSLSDSVSFEIQLKGALYGLDDYLAYPTFPSQPIPYETLIADVFDQSNHPCRLGNLKITFPPDWTTVVPSNNDPAYLAFLKPWGVSTGQQWTGFTSRQTGTWQPCLTGFVQSLLTSMFADHGAQWTIRNLGNRRPELYLRTKPDPGDPNILVLDMGVPGVNLSLTKDYTQRANVIYGSGQDDAGITYNNMQVTPNGKQTYYQPYASDPVAYPTTGNPSYDPSQRAKQVYVQFQQGMSEDGAFQVAQAQLQRFNEPGLTGSITLTSDLLRQDGTPISRFLIKAGEDILVKGVLGVPEGVLFHISAVSIDFANLQTTLTVDSKYRDELTVSEVQARTRDALSPLHALQEGKFSVTTQDLLMQWSYAAGSGFMPQASTGFFNQLPNTAAFPYEDYTTKYPPKTHPNYYIKIGPTSRTTPADNWSGIPDTKSGSKYTLFAIPIRMSQAGTAKLTQIAAYDINGHVLPIKFHASLYGTGGEGVTAQDMPIWSPDSTINPNSGVFPPKLGPRSGHPAGWNPRGWTTDDGVNYPTGGTSQNPIPWFAGAWETTAPDGHTYPTAWNTPANGASLVVGWGNYYEPAGFWPGRFSQGATPSGMLSDGTGWTWDLSSTLAANAPNPIADSPNPADAGMLWLMIYCEDQGNQPVFFLGRVFRQEPGSS